MKNLIPEGEQRNRDITHSRKLLLFAIVSILFLIGTFALIHYKKRTTNVYVVENKNPWVGQWYMTEGLTRYALNIFDVSSTAIIYELSDSTGSLYHYPKEDDTEGVVVTSDKIEFIVNNKSMKFGEKYTRILTLSSQKK